MHGLRDPGRPGRPAGATRSGEVYVLIGDGTYLMNPTELVTAVQEGLKITVVVSENHGYQCIRRLQMWRTGISFGNEFRHRDPATNRLEGDYIADRSGRERRELRCREPGTSQTPRTIPQGALRRGPRRDSHVRDRRRGREAPGLARRRLLVGRGAGGGQPGHQDPRTASRVRTRQSAVPAPALLIMKTRPVVRRTSHGAIQARSEPPPPGITQVRLPDGFLLDPAYAASSNWAIACWPSALGWKNPSTLPSISIDSPKRSGSQVSVDGYRWVENAGRISTNVQRFAFAAAAIALLSGMVIGAREKLGVAQADQRGSCAARGSPRRLQPGCVSGRGNR